MKNKIKKFETPKTKPMLRMLASQPIGLVIFYIMLYFIKNHLMDNVKYLFGHWTLFEVFALFALFTIVTSFYSYGSRPIWAVIDKTGISYIGLFGPKRTFPWDQVLDVGVLPSANKEHPLIIYFAEHELKEIRKETLDNYDRSTDAVVVYHTDEFAELLAKYYAGPISGEELLPAPQEDETEGAIKRTANTEAGLDKNDIL
jgi:hypothetical protein